MVAVGKNRLLAQVRAHTQNAGVLVNRGIYSALRCINIGGSNKQVSPATHLSDGIRKMARLVSVRGDRELAFLQFGYVEQL